METTGLLWATRPIPADGEERHLRGRCDSMPGRAGPPLTRVCSSPPTAVNTPKTVIIESILFFTANNLCNAFYKNQALGHVCRRSVSLREGRNIRYMKGSNQHVREHVRRRRNPRRASRESRWQRSQHYRQVYDRRLNLPVQEGGQDARGGDSEPQRHGKGLGRQLRRVRGARDEGVCRAQGLLTELHMTMGDR